MTKSSYTPPVTEKTPEHPRASSTIEAKSQWKKSATLTAPRRRPISDGPITRADSPQLVQHKINQQTLSNSNSVRANLIRVLQSKNIKSRPIRSSIQGVGECIETKITSTPNAYSLFYPNGFSPLWPIRPTTLKQVTHEYLISNTEELYNSEVNLENDIVKFLSTQFNKDSKGFDKLVSDVKNLILERLPLAREASESNTNNDNISIKTESDIPKYVPIRGAGRADHLNALAFYQTYKAAYLSANIKYQEDMREYDPALFKALRSYLGSAAALDAVLPKGGETRAIEILKNEEPGTPRFIEAAKYLGDFYRRSHEHKTSSGPKF